MNWFGCIYREGFVKQCLEFQRDIDNNDELRTIISEKEFLENEFCRLEEKNSMLRTSMEAFVEEILDDLRCCNCGYCSHFRSLVSIPFTS